MNRHLFEHSDELVQAIMKLGAAADIAEWAGKHIGGLKEKGKNLAEGAAEMGGRFAKGVGVKPENQESFGKTLGYGTLAAGGLYAGHKGLNKGRDFKRRHNFGDGGGYGGY